MLHFLPDPGVLGVPEIQVETAIRICDVQSGREFILTSNFVPVLGPFLNVRYTQCGCGRCNRARIGGAFFNHSAKTGWTSLRRSKTNSKGDHYES